MPPLSKQKKHCQAMNDQKVRQVSPSLADKPCFPNPTKANADLMVLGGLMDGNSYAAQSRQAYMHNQIPVSSATYYRHQNNILPTVTSSAKKSVEYYSTLIKDDAKLSIDAQWNHRRNGTAANLTIIDNQQNKVVGWETITKDVGSFKGNYGNGPSSNMETAGLQRALTKIENNIKNKNITIVHDHDNKSSKIIRESPSNLSQSYDLGHATQELKRKGEKFFNECAESIYYESNPGFSKEQLMEFKKAKGRKKKSIIKPFSTCKKIFSLLIVKLIAWFGFLVKNCPDKKKRVQQWQNAGQHFIGNHEHCVHSSQFINDTQGRGRPRDVKEKNDYWVWKEGKDDPKTKQYLDNFLLVTTPLIEKTEIHRTQANESLNADISNRAPKNKFFTVSNEARAAIAVGSKNNPHFQTELIQTICPNAISPQCLSGLAHLENERLQKNQMRNSPEEKERKNQLRRISRENHKQPVTNNIGYKLKSKY